MYDLYCSWLQNPADGTVATTSTENTTATVVSHLEPGTQPEDITPVSKRVYHDIFVNEFNYGFGTPRSDTCATCNVGSDDMHHQRYKQAFDQQKTDRLLALTSEDVTYITFDLQKTMPLPKLSVGIAFYLRQLWMYNLGVHAISKNYNKPYYHIWTEDISGRGCEEIASCLLAFVEEIGLGRANTTEGTHLIAWSDSCSGQNKNFVMLSVWQFLMLTKKFKIIDHKFPEPGHTFLDSDRDFAQIEKLVQKHENIYTIDQYMAILIESQSRKKPSVTRMDSRFFTLKDLPKSLGLTNNHTNTQGEAVKFRDGIRWIRVTEFGSYQYREAIDESLPWKKVILSPASCQPPENIELVPKSIKCGSRINTKKLADIKKQLPYVPIVYRGFYQDIINRASTMHADNTAGSSSCNESASVGQSTTQCDVLASPVDGMEHRDGRRSTKRKRTNSQTCTSRKPLLRGNKKEKNETITKTLTCQVNKNKKSRTSTGYADYSCSSDVPASVGQSTTQCCFIRLANDMDYNEMLRCTRRNQTNSLLCKTSKPIVPGDNKKKITKPIIETVTCAGNKTKYMVQDDGKMDRKRKSSISDTAKKAIKTVISDGKKQKTANQSNNKVDTSTLAVSQQQNMECESGQISNKQNIVIASTASKQRTRYGKKRREELTCVDNVFSQFLL